jgi:hypothetical protein
MGAGSAAVSVRQDDDAVADQLETRRLDLRTVDQYLVGCQEATTLFPDVDDLPAWAGVISSPATSHSAGTWLTSASPPSS